MIGSTFESFLEELQQSNWDPEATSKNQRNHKSLYQWSTDQNAQLKIARLVPIFKPGDKALFSNYRPISVLSCFSKFLERIIYNRIINYLNDFYVLCDNQYGFRKNRSPSLALIDLCDKISSAFDRREHAIGVFLDLSKASDTVNHVILFDKPWSWSGTRMGKKLFI